MLTIVPLRQETLSQLNQSDSRFLAGDRVQLRVTRKGFAPEYVPLTVAEWRSVKPPTIDASRLLADPNAACFLAYAQAQFAGQAIVQRGAHHLAELLDFRVDSRFRRQGAGSQLVSACADWAQRQGCLGLRVEVSDEQPVACQFLEHIGFVLGGVDRLSRSAEPEQRKRLPAMRESVLMFYRFFD